MHCAKLCTVCAKSYIVQNNEMCTLHTGLEILYIWAAGLRAKKKTQEPKTQEEGKKEEMGREKKKRRGVRRGKRGKEVGKKDQTNIRTQKKQGGI